MQDELKLSKEGYDFLVKHYGIYGLGIFLYLLRHASKSGGCETSERTISRELKTTRHSVRAVLRSTKLQPLYDHQPNHHGTEIQVKNIMRFLNDPSKFNHTYNQVTTTDQPPQREKERVSPSPSYSPIPFPKEREKACITNVIQYDFRGRNGSKDPVSKLVWAWKELTGVNGDPKWDKLHYGRIAKSCKKLLEYFENYAEVYRCMRHVKDMCEKQSLNFTIETVVKHTDTYRREKEKVNE